jgi:hypothetical protein
MTARDQLREQQGANGHNSSTGRSATTDYKVMFDDKGKLLLPELQNHDDAAGLCSWLTASFNLDGRHRITSGIRQGVRGPDGHVVLARVDAAPIRFEPAARINNPTRLIETLSWQTLPTDGAIYALKADHCREISYAVRMLCGLHKTMTDADEAEAIVGDLMSAGEPVEGHTTYGTPGQRYEAAVALRRAVDEVTGRKIGQSRYLLDAGRFDASTGELTPHEQPVYVVAIGDLQETARRHIGSTLPRGWLDARMETLGWARITIDGHQIPGRDGRNGPHARIYAYRGALPAREDQDTQETVTT